MKYSVCSLHYNSATLQTLLSVAQCCFTRLSASCIIVTVWDVCEYFRCKLPGDSRWKFGLRTCLCLLCSVFHLHVDPHLFLSLHAASLQNRPQKMQCVRTFMCVSMCVVIIPLVVSVQCHLVNSSTEDDLVSQQSLCASLSFSLSLWLALSLSYTHM